MRLYGDCPRLISLMAQNNQNCGPPIPHNALKFGIAYVYDSLEES